MAQAIADKKYRQSLTTKKLDQWLSYVETPSSTNLISRFGLRNSSDIIAYFRTPGGKSAEGVVASQINEIQAINDEQQFKILEKRRRLHRIRAYIILIKAHKHHVNEHDKYEYILDEQAKKRLRAQPKPSAANLKQEKRNYDATKKIIEITIDEMAHELRLLNQEINYLDTDEKQLQNRLTQYEAVFAKIFAQSKMLLGGDESILQERLQSEMSSYAKISKSLEPSNQVKFSSLKLTIDLLRDVSLVRKQERFLFNEQGQPVDDFTNAHFIVPQDKRLSLEGGKFHLYPTQPSMEYDKLNLQQQRQQAQENFLTCRPDILCRRVRIQSEIKEQFKEYRADKTNLATQRRELETQMDELKNQLTQVIRAQNKYENKMAPSKNLTLTRPMDHKQLPSVQLKKKLEEQLQPKPRLRTMPMNRPFHSPRPR